MGDLARPSMTQQDAERLTERIRITAHNYAEARQKLYELVQEAREGGAHEALGYKSWTAYLADVLGDEPMRLARGERQEMVRMLSDEGMSTRAIAPIVGASVGQVHTDRQVFRTEHQGAGEAAPRETTGRDGKTYTQPAPVQFDPDPETVQPKPRAEAITSQFNSAVVDLNRLMDKFHRITTQDAYTRNTDKLSTLYKNDITRAVTDLQTILNTL